MKKISHVVIMENRALELGKKYVLCKDATVRKIAKEYGVSKSTVYKDLSERLKEIDGLLYKEVYDKMSQNKEERAFRGGNATKQKYLSIRQGRL